MCSASEKCSGDIAKKLLDWGVSPDDAALVIERLVAEKFIDNERFTGFFVRDKFRFNKWGRVKIGYELKMRKIEPSVIAEALDGIDEEEYRQTLYDLLVVRLRQEKKSDVRLRKAALVRFGASRGFEPDLCYRVAERLLGEE